MPMGATPAEAMNSDFEELLSIFNQNGVRYLIVGGHAVMLYTEPYRTPIHEGSGCVDRFQRAKRGAGVSVAVEVRRASGRSDREGLRRRRFFLQDGYSAGARGYPDVDG